MGRPMGRYFFTASLMACLASSTAPLTLPLASSSFPSRSSFLSPVAAPAACLILPLALSMSSPMDSSLVAVDAFRIGPRVGLARVPLDAKAWCASSEPPGRCEDHGKKRHERLA